MRGLKYVLILLIMLAISACSYWPTNLETLEEAVNAEISGNATAWLVGSNVVVINIAQSPNFSSGTVALQALASTAADLAIRLSEVELESVAVAFHEAEISEAPDKMHEYIFLVKDGQPVPLSQPEVDAINSKTPNTARTTLLKKTDQQIIAKGDARFDTFQLANAVTAASHPNHQGVQP